MIDNAADYEFVRGITNKEIVIDGDILPVRESYDNPLGIKKPHCLRGEDVAFLMEAANERNSVIAGEAEITYFKNEVSASQLATICTNLHRHIRIGTASQPCYIKKDFVFSDKWIEVSEDLNEYEYYENKEDLAPAKLYQESILLDKSASPNDFLSNGSWSLENISKMFDDVARQRRMYCGDQNLWATKETDLPDCISSQFDRNMNYYGLARYPQEPIYNTYDDSNVLFYNIGFRWEGAYETHTLNSFEMELPISVFSSSRLSQVTVLAVCYARSWWRNGTIDETEKHLGIIPLDAEMSNDKWTIQKNEIDKVVDKVAAKMSRPIRGSSVWVTFQNCLEYAYVGLLGAIPIVTLGDHTNFDEE